MPRIHSLETLLPKIQAKVDFLANFELLEDLDKLYIDARYSGDLGLLPYGKPTLFDAVDFKKLAEDIYQNIERLLRCYQF